MGIIAWILVGSIASALADRLETEDEGAGTVGKLALGLTGALAGGFLGNVLSDGGFDANAAGISGAVVGSVVALLVLRIVVDRGFDRV